MGNEGAQAVCDLLTENKTITYVDLRGTFVLLAHLERNHGRSYHC